MGTESLCTHRFLLVLGHASALNGNSISKFMFQKASDRANCSVSVHLYTVICG